MNISNDKKSFYQWETNRFLVDEDFKINQEVCFSSVKLRKALVVKTKLKNNKIVVEVPNLLLQDYHPIMVHWVIADENGKYVTKEQEFQVLKRAKPEDYVYTETEIFSFLDLEQRLKNLEEEGINKAIADYFVKNPIQSGATSEQAAQIIQNKENIEKLNKNKLDADKLPEAINNALAQAEASGVFKGEPGKDGVVPVTGAAVGQTVKITAVDENGNPTEWEATDFPESSTQADWNQNNPEDGGYIANRTHYDYIAHILKTKEEISAIINSHGMPRYGEVLEDLTFRVVVDGTVYDNVPVCYTHYTGSDTWGIGDIYDNSSPKNPWWTTNYGFCYSLYGPIHNSDVFPNGIQSIEIYTAEKKSKQLDPKYIKDMYYETPEVWTTLDIVDNGNKLITNYYWEINKPYKLRVDGVVYSFDSITKGAYHSASGSYTWYFGSEPLIANTIIVNNWNYPFTIYSTGYGGPRRETYVLFEDGAVDHTVEVFESETIVHTIAPKYIKDMYYEEENLVNIAGLEYFVINPMSNGVTEYTYDYIPLELGQTWDVCYNPSNNDNFTAGDYSSMPVQEDEDGNLYIGDPEVNTYPFYITSNFIRVNANWYSIIRMTVVKIVGVSGTYTNNPIIHHLDPKYIKDMYHEEPVELFSVENAEFVDNAYMLETPFAIEDGNTYIVNWDGVEYTCEAYPFDGFSIIGNTAEFGGKGNGEPFIIGYSKNENATIVESLDGLTTHTISITEMVRHTIAPKYIKDMYYDEENVIFEYVANTTRINNVGVISGFDINKLYIFELNGVDYQNVPTGNYWSPAAFGEYNWFGSFYNLDKKNLIEYVGWEDTNYPFCFAYRGANDSLVIINEEISFPATFKIKERIIRQIDHKYLPILEEDYETIFKANVTDIIELRGPAYGKLLGKYTVVIDGVSETVEFIDDGIRSFVETESFFIESWTDPEGNVDNNGFAMGFIPPDNIVHSVKIARVKDVIKEEYLPDSVTAKPDWNQSDEASSDYVKNRTHYDDITHYLIDGAFVNLDINQLYTVQIYDDIYENVPVYNAGSNNDPRWGVGDMRVVNYPFGFFKYPCWPSNDIINTELSMISFDRNIYPDATINDVQIYQRILKKLDEKYIPDSVKGMLVTVSEDAEGNLVASNNSEEIIAAYEAGVCVRLGYNRLVHDLTLIMENMPIFLCMVPNSQTNIGVYMIVVNADYTINVQEESYNIPTIDATLAIEGAAADAKATGDAISAVSALVGDVAVSEQIENAIADAGFVVSPFVASVGQTIVVKSVDENGKPTEWEAVDVSNIEGSNGIGIKSIRIEEVM